jgi:hypothetical protein
MALLTNHFYINQVKNFIKDLTDKSHSYYVFAGLPQPWPNDAIPPVANNSLDQYELSIYDDLLFGKLITPSDISPLIPRYNWTTGTVYASYNNSDPDLFTKQFFVVTNDYRVFKCIFNNYGAASIIKPSLTISSGTFLTGDGYIWKYMYTIDVVANTKFTSANYIPVATDINVASNTIGGTIDAIIVSNSGNNWQIYESNNIVNVISSTIIQIPTASHADNYYAGSSIYLKSGYGAGQIRKIVASSAANKTISVSPSTPFNTFNTLFISNFIGTAIPGYTVQQPSSGANGIVVDTNLSSLIINIANSSVINKTFILGELVDLVDSANVIQGANGIVAFANTTKLILAKVQGSVNWTNSLFWSNTYFAKGESSLIKYNISSVNSNPNVTIGSQNQFAFTTGQPIYFSLAGSNTASANIFSSTTIPNNLTQYEIGPSVSITGDGYGALALGVVNKNNNANNISSIELINSGFGYTFANVTISANANYGSGAQATVSIASINGHGFDAISELGARYLGIDKTFDIGDNEGYYFPVNGSYRRIGIIEDPIFYNVQVGLSNFDRVNLSLVNTNPLSGPWTPGEIVVQLSTNSAGIVIGGNSTVLQLKNVRGPVANQMPYFSNGDIYGYSSGTYANVVSANTIYFNITSNLEIVSEVSSNATATISAIISNTSLLLNNVSGQFTTGDVLFDSVSNAYATVTTISTANGSRNQTNSFGLKFNELSRITLTSNSGAFSQFEFVQQDTSGANGFIISTNSDIDMTIINSTGSFGYGSKLIDPLNGSNAVVIFANSSYVKLTNASNSNFVIGHTINNGTYSANVSVVYPVIVMNNINGNNVWQPSININGQPTGFIYGITSGANGQCNNATLISYPDLIREKGKVIYMENIQPVTRTINSREETNLVIKF